MIIIDPQRVRRGVPACQHQESGRTGPAPDRRPKNPAVGFGRKAGSPARAVSLDELQGGGGPCAPVSMMRSGGGVVDARLGASQLTTIDAARISSIIEEALEKLSFLASITPDVMAHRDELSQIVGDEITRIIQEQRSLETQYEQLVAQRNALKAQSNKAKFHDNQEQIKEVARALRESTKELTRNLKGNPNIAENLSKIQTERSNLQNLLSKTLRELRESSFSTLTTTVEEEKMRTDMLLEVISNEKKVSASVKNLQEQLAAERAQHEADIDERCEPRRRPTSSVREPPRLAEAAAAVPAWLHVAGPPLASADSCSARARAERRSSPSSRRSSQICARRRRSRRRCAAARRTARARATCGHLTDALLRTVRRCAPRFWQRPQYLKKEARARGESMTRVYTQREREIADEIFKLTKQLEIETRVNKESEAFLRQKANSLAEDIEMWMQRHDDHLNERERELETLSAQRADDLLKLNAFKERYDKDMEEKKRKEEEARLQTEAERVRAQQEARNTHAATMIQAAWRGFQVRQAAKNAGKKGKKGKKGGKGGKGGKGKKKK